MDSGKGHDAMILSMIATGFIAGMVVTAGCFALLDKYGAYSDSRSTLEAGSICLLIGVALGLALTGN